jgi:hypothetical protein
MSSSEPLLHFGLGIHEKIDSLLVVWPDGRMELNHDIQTNQKLILDQKNARQGPGLIASLHPKGILLKEITDSLGLNWKHQEDGYIDFIREAFIPHMQSTMGPHLAVADVNGDGMEDFFVGGGKLQSGELFIQTTDGKFKSGNNNPFKLDSASEDVDAIFFDADGDKDMDLYVCSGGYEYPDGAALNNDRLYLNDGKGNFTRSTGLPAMASSKSCVTVAQFFQILWNYTGILPLDQ